MADPRVVADFRRAVRAKRASPKVAKALFEAGLTESNLQNLRYGDRDSLGSLQERTSIYGRGQALNPYASALRFINEAQPVAGKYGTAGQLAQAVQRSAFPGRYQQHAAQASSFLGGQMPSAPAASAPASYGAPDGRQQAILSLLGLGNLTGGYGGQDPLTAALLQANAAARAPARQGRTSTPQTGGVAHFDGKPVEAWIAPILKQARATGLWKGSVTSGQRTKAQQLAAANRFGLQHYGAGGPFGSNHLAGRGAVDVSDPQGLKRALSALHLQSRLRSAMPNDPVHFSKSGY